MKLLNKEQIAKEFGMSVANVIRLAGLKTPIPYYKRTGNKFMRNGVKCEVPKSFGKAKWVFVYEDVDKWFKSR